MKYLTIEYGDEFISNRIKDELLLNDIWNFSEKEKMILSDIQNIFDFEIELSRNINTLSGGQRSIAYLVTLAYIIEARQKEQITLNLINIRESLSPLSNKKLETYLKDKNINVAK